MCIRSIVARLFPYRFHPTARLVFRLSVGFAAVLAVFAVLAEPAAARFADSMLVLRTADAAKDTVPTMIAVGIFSAVWLDLGLRQYGNQDS